MANEYDVNYDDKRFVEVEADKQAAMNEVESTYGGMIKNSDQYFDKQIEAAQDWADKQTQLQNEQTALTVEQINQQKDQAKKDYTKEQSGAYVDWQKQTNQYGANAEQMAASGMTNTGFSESSQVSMYNTYQNRVATARESYNRAVLNYDNSIKEARLQNNAALAEIAYQALQTQLELSLQGFQYKNQLITDQMNKKMEVDDRYYSRYQDVLDQINQENQFAYQQERDKIADQQWQKTFDEQIRQFNKEYDLKMKEYEEGIRQFNEEIARLKAKDAKEYEVEIKQLEQQKAALEEEKRQFDKTHSLQLQQMQQAKITKTSSSSSNRTSTKGTGSSSRLTTGSSGIVKAGSSKSAVNKDDTGSRKTTLTYSDVAATAAQLRKSGASKAEILQYINTTVASKNYKATTSVSQDHKELISGYVGHSGR